MLELRPTCENCNRELPPHATDARICSYECTFCARCVTEVLDNVCPNCGGGFEPRPIRPQRPCRDGVCLDRQPASDKRVHKPVNGEVHSRFSAVVRNITPEQR